MIIDGISRVAAFEARLLGCSAPTDGRAVAELDLGLRRNAGRIAFYGLLLLAFMTSGLYLFGAGRLSLVESALASLGLMITLPSGVVAAWTRPRSFASRPAQKLLFLVLCAVVGGFVGAWLASSGDWPAYVEKIERLGPKVVFVTTSIGVAMAGLATGLGILRQREVVAVESRVRAESDARLREEKLAHSLAEARLAALQAQVEPHFLFNSMAAIVELSEAGAPKAAELCQRLVDFLRCSLSGLRARGTTLEADLDLVAAYLQVMAIRLGDRLRWSIDVPAELRAAALPAAMVISLVENAIKHGVEPFAPPSAIRIAARRDDDRLVLVVEDTGQGIGDRPGDGLGLANIRERLQLQFADRGDLTIEANRPRGTRAVLRVPYPMAVTG